ncbi:MAG TPA: ferritin [bacterium]|nr:ferritin [bacterium]
MISKKMADALNGQIHWEMYSAYVYLAMSANSDTLGLKGCANWFMAQYREEMEHAMKIYDYLLEQGAEIELMAIDQPQKSYPSALAMFETALEHEKDVTRRIHKLVDQAITEKDHATQIILQWFVTEQVEEEANVSEIIGKMKMVGDKGNGLFMIDRELANRE